MSVTFSDKLSTDRLDGKLLDSQLIDASQDGGVTKEQLDSDVQATLGKADAVRTDIPRATPARAGKARVVNADGDGYTDSDLATLAEALDNATTLAELQAKTRDIHASDYPGTWDTADDAKIIVTTAVPPQRRAVVPAAAAWASATAEVTQPIPSNLRDTLVFLQLPVGATRSNYRVVRANTGDNGASSTGTIDSSRWSGLSSGITGDYPAGLYEQVYEGDLGSHWNQIVWTVQKHSAEVHKTEYKGIFDGTFSDRVEDEIVTVDKIPPAEEADTYQRERLDAVGIKGTVGAFADATAEDLANGYGVFFRASLNIADGPTIETAPYVLQEGVTPAGVTVTPFFQVPAGVNPARMRLQHIRGGSVLDTLPRATDQWRRIPGRDVANGQYLFTDRYDTIVAADLPLIDHDTITLKAGDTVKLQIAPETFRFAQDHNEARVAALEDKTSHVGFDDGTKDWVPADNTAVGGNHPYGKWAWIFRGSQVDSYKGHDFDGPDDFDDASGAGPSGAGYGLLWVLPNNLNWSRLHLVVRRADGSVKSTILAQALRNAPATIVVTNLPVSPPDVTVRWSSHDDTHPFATTNFEMGDTVALEVLPSAHVPVWEGELRAETEDLLTETKAYLDSLDELRLEVDPPSLVISSVPAEFDVGSGVTTAVTDDIAAEHPLVESLVRSIRHGYDRPLRVSGSFKFYFQRAQPQTTSGAILSMTLTLRVRGKQLSKTLIDEFNTIQEFTDAQTANGDFNYPPVNNPSKQFDLDTLLDLSDWTTLEDDDEIQFHLEGGNVNAQARIRLDFDDVALAFDHANIRGVPDLPEPEEQDGKALKFAGTVLGWQPSLMPSTILANDVRASIGANLNGLRWEAHGNALGGTGSVTTASSGRKLVMNGRLVAKSKSFGIIVRIERDTPTRIASEVFIPWALFRTGSGTYVTGGGHGTQGVWAGFWDDSRAGSSIFATCDMDESNGNLELQINGAYGDGASRMTIHLAR